MVAPRLWDSQAHRTPFLDERFAGEAIFGQWAHRVALSKRSSGCECDFAEAEV